MPTLGFLIDNRKCIGCHACTVACKSEHEVPLGVDRTWVKYIEKGAFPNNRRMFTVMRCNHCDHSPCTTICPVTALYRRDDGVVDFNNDRCIGCKACMQACPYDALYIDPATSTAAKCNFCTHRLDAGLEPSCVAVCPEQAIVIGDLDDPGSKISQLIERHPVQVRKPEKGTKPKLCYIEADEAALVPSRTEPDRQFIWSRGDAATNGHSANTLNVDQSGHDSQLPIITAPPEPSRVYDVRPRPPAWGWEVVAYTWTKAIAAGSFLAVGAARLFGSEEMAAAMSVWMGIVAIVFLLATTALLIADLKQPKRFLYVLLRPQWKSWLVRGAYALVSYGGILTIWLVARLVGADGLADALLWPGSVLAVLSAVYTAFLFAQAKGRDLWQNPLLSLHLLAHALLAGGAIWLLFLAATSNEGTVLASRLVIGTLVFSLVTLLAEIMTAHPTADARKAMKMIIGQEYGIQFWVAGVCCGHVLPLVLLWLGGGWALTLAALLVLSGIFAVERLWILAPQRIPLS
ncbi:MAG: polysulfide reductase NrfD [Pirellulales bacterium]|nr:polysulfide reductase NrfD [Pirellulales bacterium]